MSHVTIASLTFPLQIIRVIVLLLICLYLSLYIVAALLAIICCLKACTIATVLLFKTYWYPLSPSQQVLRYLGRSFYDPTSLIQGMASGSFILSGSRALDFFFPGSCRTESDWDFYTYGSEYCVGIALEALSTAGVVWEDC